MKKVLILVFAALMIPSVALAAKPSHHGPKAPPQVTYVLKGTLSNYTAYNAGTMTNGSVTIAVTAAGPHAKSLKGATLTFAVDAKTKLSLRHHQTTVTNGDTGIIKVRAANKNPRCQSRRDPAGVCRTPDRRPGRQEAQEVVALPYGGMRDGAVALERPPCPFL